MVSNKKAPTANREGLSDVLSQEQGNDSSSQRKRLVEAMTANGSITTIAARRELDILCPAARVLELRKDGWRIDTAWATEPTLEGRTHRVARYVLQSAPKAMQVSQGSG